MAANDIDTTFLHLAALVGGVLIFPLYFMASGSENVLASRLDRCLFCLSSPSWWWERVRRVLRMARPRPSGGESNKTKYLQSLCVLKISKRIVSWRHELICNVQPTLSGDSSCEALNQTCSVYEADCTGVSRTRRKWQVSCWQATVVILTHACMHFSA